MTAAGRGPSPPPVLFCMDTRKETGLPVTEAEVLTYDAGESGDFP